MRWFAVPLAIALAFLVLPVLAIFLDSPPGELLAALGEPGALDALWLSLRTSATALAIIVVVMLSLDAKLALLSFAVLPVIALVTILFRSAVRDSYRRIRTAVARINSYLQERVNGMSVVQLFNAEKKSANQFDRINREHMEAFKDAIFAYGWFYPIVEFLGMTALALLLLLVGLVIILFTAWIQAHPLTAAKQAADEVPAVSKQPVTSFWRAGCLTSCSGG